jgi:hypothetical protein
LLLPFYRIGYVCKINDGEAHKSSLS